MGEERRGRRVSPERRGEGSGREGVNRRGGETRIEAVPECSGEIQFPCCGQARRLYSAKELMRKMSFATYTGPHSPQEFCTVHNQIPADDLQISIDPIGQQY